MTSLTSLIERIEAATEGSRELDVAVILALHPEAGPYQPYCQGDEPIFWNDPYRKMRCPKVSTSIDAALTLMPEGWHVAALGFIPADKFRAGWYCELVSLPGNYCFVGLDDPMDFHPADPSRIATPALALLAAILRARQTEATND